MLFSLKMREREKFTSILVFLLHTKFQIVLHANWNLRSLCFPWRTASNYSAISRSALLCNSERWETTWRKESVWKLSELMKMWEVFLKKEAFERVIVESWDVFKLNFYFEVNLVLPFCKVITNSSKAHPVAIKSNFPNKIPLIAV